MNLQLRPLARLVCVGALVGATSCGGHDCHEAPIGAPNGPPAPVANGAGPSIGGGSSVGGGPASVSGGGDPNAGVTSSGGAINSAGNGSAGRDLLGVGGVGPGGGAPFGVGGGSPLGVGGSTATSGSTF